MVKCLFPPVVIGRVASSTGPSTSLRVVSLSNQQRLRREAEGREEKGRGRPFRKVRLMVLFIGRGLKTRAVRTRGE